MHIPPLVPFHRRHPHPHLSASQPHPFPTDSMLLQIARSSELHGKNSFEIPMPTLWELYKEQLSSPIAIFQLFCCVLWMLDEYWKVRSLAHTQWSWGWGWCWGQSQVGSACACAWALAVAVAVAMTSSLHQS